MTTTPTTVSPESKLVTLNDGLEYCVHVWKPPRDTPPKCVAVIFHGFLAAGTYPTVRYAAEILANDANINALVVAGDMQGHGKSPGTPGLLASPQGVLAGGVALAQYAQGLLTESANDHLKLFLVGSSMGGTIALHVAQQMPKSISIAGVVLLAPMLRLSVSAPERILLSGLAALPGLVSHQRLIPSSSTNDEKQYRDPKKRQECRDAAAAANADGEKKSSCIPIASAHTCVQLAHSVMHSTSGIPSLKGFSSAPVFLAVALEDVVVKNQGSYDFYEAAQLEAKDKCLKEYPALHGLLCEPPPLADQIETDILAWVQERC